MVLNKTVQTDQAKCLNIVPNPLGTNLHYTTNDNQTPTLSDYPIGIWNRIRMPLNDNFIFYETSCNSLDVWNTSLVCVKPLQ